MAEIKSALISCWNKEGVVEFAKELQKLGVSIISTGGTARELKKGKVKVVEVEELTNSPEMLDGRVKTLHPKIHAGILAIRKNKTHMKQLKEQGVSTIDMVVINLYPFVEGISDPKIKLENAIELIDIGGPTMLRAAAKNYGDVAVVCNPARYGEIIAEMKKGKGKLSLETKKILAKEVFEHTSTYDATIADYLNKKFTPGEFPEKFSLGFEKAQDCRYGENPHQKAAFYKEFNVTEPSITTAVQLQGKELSFNNINDADGTIELCKEFSEATCVIVKHANPCGVASAEDISTAFSNALECDPTSAFGGIIALNRECDAKTAEKIISFFNEIVIAPSYSKKSLEILAKKKNLRVLELKGLGKEFIPEGINAKKVVGGLLVQERDMGTKDENKPKTVTEEKPSEDEMKSLLFAWKVCKHVKSNAIVLIKGTQTVGIGAGQMSRVDAAELAVKKAGVKASTSVLASDAFFPFRDSIDAAAEAGITAIIQPGGSIKDDEVIAAANEKGLAMVFTGTRHFRH